MPKRKVSVPLVANQGDLLTIDGNEYLVEQPTGANHYLTLRSVEDPDEHLKFATAADFTEWWAIREELSLTRRMHHDREAPEAEETEEGVEVVEET